MDPAWALVITTVALAGATAALAVFTWMMLRASHALSKATEALVAQANRQVEATKMQIREDRLKQGLGPPEDLEQL